MQSKCDKRDQLLLWQHCRWARRRWLQSAVSTANCSMLAQHPSYCNAYLYTFKLIYMYVPANYLPISRKVFFRSGSSYLTQLKYALASMLQWHFFAYFNDECLPKATPQRWCANSWQSRKTQDQLKLEILFRCPVTTVNGCQYKQRVWKQKVAYFEIVLNLHSSYEAKYKKANENFCAQAILDNYASGTNPHYSCSNVPRKVCDLNEVRQ